MPNLRTTVTKKIRASEVSAGDHFKIAGRWYRVVHNHTGYLDHHERNLRLVPENTTDDFSPRRIVMTVHSLVKLKVRTPKYK